MSEPLAQRRELAAFPVGEAVLAAALRVAPDAIALVDRATSLKTVVYCNDAFSILTGYAAEDIVGREISALAPPEQLEALDRLGALADAAAELQLRRRDGSMFWAAVTARPVYDIKGGLTHVVLTHHDLTGHRERDAALALALREAERANWAKSRLIAVAGHDLRQPLQTIVGALELMHRELELTERGRRLLSHAETAAGDLDEELKALAQISGVKQDLAPAWETFPVDDLIEQVARAWRPRAEHKGLDLRVIGSGLVVRSDRMMLRTIVRNLIGNAIKYTAHGRVLVGVRRRGPMACLEVWDTGPGVSPHMISRVFDAFERADAPGEGLGLGLWIVQRTAEILGHSVGVRTQTQRGSCFSLTLTRVIAGGG